MLQLQNPRKLSRISERDHNSSSNFDDTFKSGARTSRNNYRLQTDLTLDGAYKVASNRNHLKPIDITVGAGQASKTPKYMANNVSTEKSFLPDVDPENTRTDKDSNINSSQQPMLSRNYGSTPQFMSKLPRISKPKAATIEN